MKTTLKSIGLRKKVIYDYQSGTWKKYSTKNTVITLGPSVKLENDKWIENNLLLEEKDELRETASNDFTNYYLPSIPKTQKVRVECQ
jgi:hypothetical protein